MPKSNLRKELERIEDALRKLKIQYDLYFTGAEKRPPIKLHEDLSRLVKRYAAMNFQNTSYRFYFNTVHNRYNTYSEMWNKQVRMREEGRVPQGRRLDTRPSASTPAAAPPLRAAQPARASGPDGAVRLSLERLEESSLRSLYDRFAEARQQAGQAAGTPAFERFRDQICSQLQRLKARGSTGTVEFKVSIKDHKVSLKARTSR
ncbi:MAG: MXAN_5187 C-terminal domain-containing protein [Acidobacteriota bacterium]